MINTLILPLPSFPPLTPSLLPSLPYRKVSQGQISIPAYSYPAGFLPMEHSGLRPAAYPFMIPGPYVATPYQHQVNPLK